MGHIKFYWPGQGNSKAAVAVFVYDASSNQVV